MLFNSFIFLIFLGVILPLFYLLPNKKSKNIFLLLSSYFFYGYWDWRFCLLLFISTIIDFIIGKYIFSSKNNKHRKLLLITSLFTNLGILFFFKYFNFFSENLQIISSNFGVELDYLHLNIIIPVGISFYTFQTLSYTIDIYRKRILPTNNFIDFALFVSFFPQLVAGPIERAKQLLPQLSKKLYPTVLQIKEGIILIVTGLFRKVIIGDTAGRLVDNIFINVENYKSIEILCAIFIFSIQIYADFSGYSKIARGTAKLLGIELMVNFEQPYLSKNITEFWRKWHISLSSWLKDYLYVSLGGNRISKNRTYLNIMITMLLGGLWHGASWNFIIWGGLHGALLIGNKYFTRNKNIYSYENLIKVSLKVFFTFTIVSFIWLFFRSTSWENTQIIFSKFLYWEKSEYGWIFIKITSAYILLTLILDIIEQKFGQLFLLKIKSTSVIIGILLSLFFVTLTYMFQATPSPFIYFQF